MVKYENGKIYKLVNNVDDKIYVGSTCTTLVKRKYGHIYEIKINRNNCPVYVHLRTVGYENVEIILIEKYPCVDKMELHKRERYWIDYLNPELNFVIPTRTYKEWRKDNAEIIKEKKKKYRKDNAEIIKEKNKKYYERNKEFINEHRKDYYELNKDEINRKRREYYMSLVHKCTCASMSHEEKKLKKKVQDANYRIKNKEVIKEKTKIKIQCPNCEKLITNANLRRHLCTSAFMHK